MTGVGARRGGARSQVRNHRTNNRGQLSACNVDAIKFPSVAAGKRKCAEVAGIISGAPAFSFRRIRRLSVSLYHRRNPKCTDAVSNPSSSSSSTSIDDSNQRNASLYYSLLFFRTIYHELVAFTMFDISLYLYFLNRAKKPLFRSRSPFSFSQHSRFPSWKDQQTSRVPRHFGKEKANGGKKKKKNGRFVATRERSRPR